MLNFHQDIVSLHNIVNQMTEWSQRGIAVNVALVPLHDQIKLWEDTMCEQLMNFKANLVMLKELDDRVRSSISIDLAVTNEYDVLKMSADHDVIGSWEQLYITYSNLFDNLNEDITVLNNAHATIVGYKNLGIELTTAITTLEQHVQKINDGIATSLSDLDKIIQNIKEVSLLVLTAQEINARNGIDNVASQQDNVASQQDNVASQQDNVASQQDEVVSHQDEVVSHQDEPVLQLDDERK